MPIGRLGSMVTHRPRVAVFLGGPSSEHEISLRTGALVLDRLDRSRFDPAPVFVDREQIWHFARLPFSGSDFRVAVEGGVIYRPGAGGDLPWRPEIAFLGLHGIYGEDGQIQRQLEALGIPYTGSGPAASALAMNKVAAKEVFHRAGLPLAADFALGAGERATTAAQRIAAKSSGPWVVKPRDGGSSVGVQIVATELALVAALEAGLRDGPVLVEVFVGGRELTCGVLEDPQTTTAAALPPTEIVPRGSGFFDFNAKYTPGASEEITPARLSTVETQRIQSLALSAHHALGCRGYSRSDFILSPHQGLVLLETNTLPGLTETSLLPQEAAALGISYPALLTWLLTSALQT